MAFRVFLTTIIVLFQIAVTAQNKKLQRANDLFDAGDYTKASEQYQKAFGNASDKAEKAAICFKIGECYRNMADAKTAERWYVKAVKYKYNDPVATLYVADMLKMQGKYPEALVEYNNFLTLLPSDPRGLSGKTACDNAVKWAKTPPTRFIVQPLTGINSRQSDFAPAYGSDGKTLYFTSTRDAAAGKNINGASGGNFADIFVSKQDTKGKWAVPLPLTGGINTDGDEGVMSVRNDEMYLTSGTTQSDKRFMVQILVSQRVGNNWGAASPVPLFDSNTVVAHPAISPNGQTLYFVSDKSGGIGGKDIWMVQKTGGGWGLPQNLGAELNSKEDDMFPFCRNDSTLYFASNRPDGLGGLDIFKAVKGKDNKWRVENMKAPINSPSDDFGITFSTEKDEGFFSSSRVGSMGSDDIYSFSLPPLVFVIEGKVIDQKTDKAISAAKVTFAGSDGLMMEQTTKADGSFKFENLKPNTDYTAIADKQGYLKAKASETTRGLEENKTLRMLISLSSTSVEIELPNIEYDLNKADLRPESMVSLDQLVQTLTDNPNITIELAAHTDFRGSDQYNDSLSQARAQSVVNYLIQKGIATDRLTAKGYGETKPKTVDAKLATKYTFLKENNVLNETFINKLPSDFEREITHQINRRTEFRVLSTNYVPKK